MEYVAFQARMNQPVLDHEGRPKSTVGDELEGLWARNPELRESPPEIPESMEPLWAYFRELDCGRGEGFSGEQPLTWEAVDAWARRMDESPEPHEVRALLEIDRVWRNPPRKP